MDTEWHCPLCGAKLINDGYPGGYWCSSCEVDFYFNMLGGIYQEIRWEKDVD